MEDNSERQQPVSKAAPPKRSLRFDEQGRINRRDFLGLLGLSAAGVVATTAIPAVSKEGKLKTPGAPKPTATVSSGQLKTQAVSEKPIGLEPLSDTDLLNKALSLPLGTKKREETEKIYLSRAQTLGQIDRGLFVVVDPDSRWSLLGERYETRQAGKSELLTPIPDDLLAWCKEERIYPEAMGVCLDAQKIAKWMIQIFLDRSTESFRPDFFEPKLDHLIPARLREPARSGKRIDAADLMMNLGGTAKLIMTETSGFKNIGTLPAVSQLNKEWKGYEAEMAALKQVCQIQRDFTGLDYRLENIPGSENFEGTITGGAIGGSQVLPSLALEMIKVGQSVGKNIIIFQNTWAAVMAWIKTAKTTKLQNGKYAVGYIVGDEPGVVAFREDSLEQWNPDPSQPGSILQTANRFSNRFGNKYR